MNVRKCTGHERICKRRKALHWKATLLTGEALSDIASCAGVHVACTPRTNGDRLESTGNHDGGCYERVEEDRAYRRVMHIEYARTAGSCEYVHDVVRRPSTAVHHLIHAHLLAYVHVFNAEQSAVMMTIEVTIEVPLLCQRESMFVAQSHTNAKFVGSCKNYSTRAHNICILYERAEAGRNLISSA